MIVENKTNGSLSPKDILDELGITKSRLKAQKSNGKKESKKSSHLAHLNKIEQQLQEYSSNKIIYSTPLVTRYNVSIIRRGTINIIQGKFGSHKSRLAELFLSLMLSDRTRSGFLEFKKNVTERFAVGLIDTERNLKEELASAIQKIKINAGFKKSDKVDTFRYTSLKHTRREDRLAAMKEWVDNLRKSTKLHLFILLDVVTDCVSSFNKDGEAMELYDFLGRLCDNTDSTFLLIIHENPGTEKARGHIGTEGANKASTVMQIGFVANKGNESSELIRLKFIKLRSAKKPDSFYLIYSPERNGLIEAPPEMVQEIIGDRGKKAPVNEVANRLIDLIDTPKLQKEVLPVLAKEFEVSEKTIKRRLDQLNGGEIMQGKIFVIDNKRGRPTLLSIESQKSN